MQHYQEYLPILAALTFGAIAFVVGLIFALRERRQRKLEQSSPLHGLFDSARKSA
jgi:hypothetical protein